MKSEQPVLGLSRDERHRYTAFYPPAAPLTLPSVTTVTGVIDKPALTRWYGKIAAAWAVDNLAAVLQMAGELGREATVAAVAARGAGERDRKAAIGTAAHQAIEALLAGMPVITTPETRPLLEQYRAFTRDWRFRPVWSEAMVASERYGYAGTFDLYGQLAGRPALIDVKTGSYMAPEMGLQLAAYAGADYIGRPGTADRWRVPRAELYAVLQLQPTEYRLIPYDVNGATFAAFLAAHAIYEWQARYGRRIIGQALEKGALAIA